MHKKGFMVKGQLAWLYKVFKSSGPSPSIPSTSLTIVKSNHNKQHKKAEKKCSKNRVLTFLGHLWLYEK